MSKSTRQTLFGTAFLACMFICAGAIENNTALSIFTLLLSAVCMVCGELDDIQGESEDES